MDDELKAGTKGEADLNLDELEGPSWRLDWDNLPVEFDVSHIAALTISQLKSLDEADLTPLQRESLDRAQGEFFKRINGAIQSTVASSFAGLGLSKPKFDLLDSGKILKALAGVYSAPNFTSALVPKLAPSASVLPKFSTPALTSVVGKEVMGLSIPKQILWGLQPAKPIFPTSTLGAGGSSAVLGQLSMGALAAGVTKRAGLAQTLSAVVRHGPRQPLVTPDWIRVVSPQFAKVTGSTFAPTHLQSGYAVSRQLGAREAEFDLQLQDAATLYAASPPPPLTVDEAIEIAGAGALEAGEAVAREGTEWALTSGDWYLTPEGKWAFKGTVFVLVFETVFSVVAGLVDPLWAFSVALALAFAAANWGHEIIVDFTQRGLNDQ